MRRGRGKGKRQNATTTAAREDLESCEEDKTSSFRKRGRPQKLMRDEIEEEEELVKKTEEEEEKGDDDTNGLVISKEDGTKNEKKRKKSVESQESDVTEEVNGLGSKSSIDYCIKSSSSSIGFRQTGRRRKNKPRRAAEAVVECIGV